MSARVSAIASAVSWRVSSVRDVARLLEKPVFGLVVDREERQRAVLPELVAEAGKIEPVHQVFDIEGGKAQRHGDLCPQAPDEDKGAAIL